MPVKARRKGSGEVHANRYPCLRCGLGYGVACRRKRHWRASMTPAHPSARLRISLAITALATVTAAVAWAYRPTLVELTHRWAQDPQYSHGWLVPVFAVALLWFRRGHLAESGPQPTWWGLP